MKGKIQLDLFLLLKEQETLRIKLEQKNKSLQMAEYLLSVSDLLEYRSKIRKINKQIPRIEQDLKRITEHINMRNQKKKLSHFFTGVNK